MAFPTSGYSPTKKIVSFEGYNASPQKMFNTSIGFDLTVVGGSSISESAWEEVIDDAVAAITARLSTEFSDPIVVKVGYDAFIPLT